MSGPRKPLTMLAIGIWSAGCGFLGILLMIFVLVLEGLTWLNGFILCLCIIGLLGGIGLVRICSEDER